MHKDSSGEALPENTFKDYHSETTIPDTTSPTELKEEKKMHTTLTSGSILNISKYVD